MCIRDSINPDDFIKFISSNNLDQSNINLSNIFTGELVGVSTSLINHALIELNLNNDVTETSIKTLYNLSLIHI